MTSHTSTPAPALVGGPDQVNSAVIKPLNQAGYKLVFSCPVCECVAFFQYDQQMVIIRKYHCEHFAGVYAKDPAGRHVAWFENPYKDGDQDRYLFNECDITAVVVTPADLRYQQAEQQHQDRADQVPACPRCARPFLPAFKGATMCQGCIVSTDSEKWVAGLTMQAEKDYWTANLTLLIKHSLCVMCRWTPDQAEAYLKLDRQIRARSDQK